MAIYSERDEVARLRTRLRNANVELGSLSHEIDRLAARLKELEKPVNGCVFPDWNDMRKIAVLSEAEFREAIKAVRMQGYEILVGGGRRIVFYVTNGKVYVERVEP